MTPFYPGQRVQFRSLTPDDEFHGRMWYVGLDPTSSLDGEEIAVVKWLRKEYRQFPPSFTYTGYYLRDLRPV